MVSSSSHHVVLLVRHLLFWIVTMFITIFCLFVNMCFFFIFFAVIKVKTGGFKRNRASSFAIVKLYPHLTDG